LIAELSLRVGSQEFLFKLYARTQRIRPGAVEMLRRVPRASILATLCNTNALQWPNLMEHRRLITAFDHYFPLHLTGTIDPDEEACV
jgi:hypothetical protein